MMGCYFSQGFQAAQPNKTMDTKIRTTGVYDTSG